MAITSLASMNICQQVFFESLFSFILTFLGHIVIIFLEIAIFFKSDYTVVQFHEVSNFSVSLPKKNALMSLLGI